MALYPNTRRLVRQPPAGPSPCPVAPYYARREMSAPLIVGYGGGVNSVAMLVGMKARGLRPDLISFADTRGEKPGTMTYIEKTLPPWLERAGFPALTHIYRDEDAKPGTMMELDESLEAESLRRKTLPSRAFGLSSCAMRWKIEPQEKFLNHWQPAMNAWARGEKPTKALGYDAGEGHRSSRGEDDKLLYWYPLREWGWDRDQCIAEIKGAGLPVPIKSACLFCPAMRKNEILDLQAQHPDLMRRALRMEAVALEAGSMTDVLGLGRHFSWAKFLAADKAQQRLFPSISAGPCLAFCTDESDD